MGVWSALLGPLVVWAVHFFGIYLAAEFAPWTLAAVTGALTLACLAALVVLVRWASPPQGWARLINFCGSALASIAIVWQTMPLFWS